MTETTNPMGHGASGCFDTSRTRVTLVWLEGTSPGTAAATHLEGTKRRIEHLGFEIEEVVASSNESRGLVGKLKRLFRLVNGLRGADPTSVVIARWHPLLALGSRRFRRRGGKIVLLVQGVDSAGYEANGWLGRLPVMPWLVRKSIERTDSIVALNVGIERWLIESRYVREGVPVVLMDSGVADVYFEAGARESTDPKRYVSFVGSLARWQGIDVLVDALASSHWPADVVLRVAGDGVEAPRLSAAPPGSLEWLGRLKPADAAELVAGSICTVCPKHASESMAEVTTPFKILESVAAGVPVVASDIPAQRRMLEAGGYGLLFEAGDAESLADAVARLATDDPLRSRLSANARSAAPQFRWESQAHILGEAVRAVSMPDRSLSRRVGPVGVRRRVVSPRRVAG